MTENDASAGPSLDHGDEPPSEEDASEARAPIGEGLVRARFRHPPPGYFAVDHRLTVLLDGAPLYDGSFLEGFAVDRDLAPGAHTLVAKLGVRTKKATIEVPDPSPQQRALDVELVYSRMWGTFSRPIVTPLAELPDPSAQLSAAERLRSPTVDHPVRATIALLIVLIAVYLAELALGLEPSTNGAPSISTLIGLGGLHPAGIERGEWYRLISATFLHGSPLHLVLNGAALLMVGVLLERMLGGRWLVALYAIGAIGGSIFSLLFNDGSMVSIGASGAIMGLFGAGIVIAQILPASTRGPVQFQLGRVLVPSLLPFLARGGDRIDFGAHLGGAIAGALAGLAVLGALRAAQTRRAIFEGRGASTSVSAAFAAACVLAALGVIVQAYPAARADAAAVSTLVPDEELSASTATREQIVQWLERYPEDPRVHTLAANLAFEDERWDDVDREIAAARFRIDAVAPLFSPEWAPHVRSSLAQLEDGASLRRELVPNSAIPNGSAEEADAAWARNLDAWLVSYPNDPRVRSYAAGRALDRRRFEEAELHARTVSEQWPRFAALFPGSMLDGWARVDRGRALLELGREAEARALFEEVCQDPSAGEPAADLRESGLCEGTDGTTGRGALAAPQR